MFTVEVCIDDRKFTRVEASDSAYDVKMKYLDLFPNSTVRVKSNSSNKIYILLSVFMMIALIVVFAFLVSLVTDKKVKSLDGLNGRIVKIVGLKKEIIND